MSTKSLPKKAANAWGARGWKSMPKSRSTKKSTMMVMGASAAKFNDADKITHTEAVNTMVALGVLKGKDTGNYDPQGIVTRAEMAKIICVSLNGGEDPTLGVKATPTYKDIKGHWAESYIEYCTSIGVIAGQGDGTFAPDATVIPQRHRHRLRRRQDVPGGSGLRLRRVRLHRHGLGDQHQRPGQRRQAL